MKIAYDSQIFAAQKYGGVSRYYCEIASRIAREPEVDASIVAPMYINAYIEHVPQALISGFRSPFADRIPTFYGARYLNLMMRALGLVIGDVILRGSRPDIIHETYFFPYRLGGRRARRVLTIYDMIHEKFASNFQLSEKTSQFNQLSEKTSQFKVLAAKRADHVICISEATRKDAIEILGLNPDQTSVIYLGYDLMKADDAAFERLVLPTTEPYLLYVGNRGGYKNFLGLLEAYGTSPQLKDSHKLVCFGGGVFSPAELARMQELNLDAGQVIQCAGSDLLLSELYRSASAFVYPSLYEGFGIPPLEAMAHDCAVVCSNTSSIPEVVGDSGNYFDPGEMESMRSAIEQVVFSETRRDSLISKGRERLELFSWDRCATETLEVYKNLLG
jgi:glycosyltransferase involved in cell wall biosynthesis